MMNTTNPLSTSDVANYYLPPEPHQCDFRRENESRNLIGDILMADNVAICPTKKEFDDKNAKIIQRFFGKVIAARSYYNMFSIGTYFKEIGNELPTVSGQPSFASLTHLDRISAGYLAQIKAKTPDLSSEEQALLKKVLGANMMLRHQSNAYLAESGLLKIYSNDYLINHGIFPGGNTFTQDKEYLHNQGFVFFGVEFSADLSQAPLNTKHSTFDFGANAYLVEERYPHGYLTLTDHFDNYHFRFLTHEHQDFIKQFPKAEFEASRRIHGDKGVHDVPIYNRQDMKLALGLHLINFVRSSEDIVFKEFSLKNDMTDKELDRLINFVFQPEFHVPGMVITPRFSEKKLRDIPLKDAVTASNLKRMNELVQSKDVACQAMITAIKKAKVDIVDMLFKQWEFSSVDLKKMRGYNMGDIEYSLSDHSASTEILAMFLERGLVDANTIFYNPNRGDTMLDNAIKYENGEMICLLKRFGALTGAELKKSSQ
ncbi:T3SS effector OspC family protein [Sodalis sp. dw_96]|uniref:T3SS effector OspC family protein n=1 Tax=Sodalis sp. dw_96 TaxID=2719794 RepID=UPI001BD37152|nr:T3SS effector OspC family protein [Sodalis sp. dw_96]